MTYAYIADVVKEIAIRFISMARLSKNHDIEMTPTTIICKGVLVLFYPCVKTVMHNITNTTNSFIVPHNIGTLMSSYEYVFFRNI